MLSTKRFIPLVFSVVAFFGNGVVANELVPPEAMRALDALNLPSRVATPGGGETMVLTMEPGTPSVAGVDWIDGRVFAVGLGAIAGVVVLNAATGGLASAPLLMSAPEVTGMGALASNQAALSANRFYGVTSAVAGALVGDYFYRKAATGRNGHLPTVPAGVAARINP